MPYLGFVGTIPVVDFPKRLSGLRKQLSLTQAQLAERIGMHVVQLRQYEAGTSQPTLEAIQKLSTALQVRADMPLFGEDERGPATTCDRSSRRCPVSTRRRIAWSGRCSRG